MTQVRPPCEVAHFHGSHTFIVAPFRIRIRRIAIRETNMDVIVNAFAFACVVCVSLMRSCRRKISRAVSMPRLAGGGIICVHFPWRGKLTTTHANTHAHTHKVPPLAAVAVAIAAAANAAADDKFSLVTFLSCLCCVHMLYVYFNMNDYNSSRVCSPANNGDCHLQANFPSAALCCSMYKMLCRCPYFDRAPIQRASAPTDDLNMCV